jgi:hypothetical protein
VNPSLIAQFRKYLIAAAGYVAALLAYGLIPDPYDKYAAALLAFLASVGVGVVPNVLSSKQLLAQPAYAPTTSIVPMPLGHPDAIKAALTVSDEKHPRGAGGKFVSKQEGTTA